MVTSNKNTRSTRHRESWQRAELTRARPMLRAGQASRIHTEVRMLLPLNKTLRAAEPWAQNNYGAAKRNPAGASRGWEVDLPYEEGSSLPPLLPSSQKFSKAGFRKPQLTRGPPGDKTGLSFLHQTLVSLCSITILLSAGQLCPISLRAPLSLRSHSPSTFPQESDPRTHIWCLQAVVALSQGLREAP